MVTKIQGCSSYLYKMAKQSLPSVSTGSTSVDSSNCESRSIQNLQIQRAKSIVLVLCFVQFLEGADGKLVNVVSAGESFLVPL